MNGLLRLACRLSAWLLRRHPLAGVLDFSAEMQAVQAQALAEAAAGGHILAWKRVLREVFGVIAVILRSWIFGRHAMPGNLAMMDETSQPTPWRTALLSLLPFLVMGPVMLALGYLPVWSSWSRIYWPLYAILVAAVFWGGILIGARQGFPRWSFPYVMVGDISLAALVNELLTGTALHNEQLLWILVIAAAWTIVTFRWRVFQPFYTRIRQDWTHLSYCFFAFILMVSASVDHDEIPRLNLLALLPSLLTLAGAFFYLRSATCRGRIGSLVGSLTLALVFWAWPVLDGMTGTLTAAADSVALFGAIYFSLLGILLAPALIGLFFRSGAGDYPVR